MISSLELAKLCGVSQGTVDRALHNRPGIREKTKARILAVAAEHGYLPNPAAMEMMYGRSDVVGIILPVINSVFYMDIVQEIKTVLDGTGARLFITPVSGTAQAADALNEFAARKARGVVLVAPPAGLAVPDHIARGTKVCTLLHPVSGTGVFHLLPDEVAAGRTAAAYLIKKGHRKLLHVTYDADSGPINDREQGFTTAARAAGATVRTVRSIDDRTILAALTASKATAVFCHNDWLALRVISLAQQQGLRVPDDVSVLGVDDSPTFNAIHPGLTTLAYPRQGIARAVAAVLNGEKRIPPVGRLELVKRKTVTNA